MVAAVAPRPQQPTPVEIINWEAGRSNARRQYSQAVAQSNLASNQAKLTAQTATRNLNYNQGIQRRGFDDPYIGRGLLHSGIRNQGLSDFYTSGANQLSDIQNQYIQAAAGAWNQRTQAGLNLQQYMNNSQAQQAARRGDLAAQIKGII